MCTVKQRDEAGERLRVVGPWRPALCDTLDDADAADFVFNGVMARALIRTTRLGGGEPASLREVDAIGHVIDGGITLILKSDGSGSFDACELSSRFLPAKAQLDREAEDLQVGVQQTPGCAALSIQSPLPLQP